MGLFAADRQLLVSAEEKNGHLIPACTALGPNTYAVKKLLP